MQGHDEDDHVTDSGRQFLRPQLDVHLEFRFIGGLEGFSDVRVPVFEALTRVSLSGYRARSATAVETLSNRSDQSTGDTGTRPSIPPATSHVFVRSPMIYAA